MIAWLLARDEIEAQPQRGLARHLLAAGAYHRLHDVVPADPVGEAEIVELHAGGDRGDAKTRAELCGGLRHGAFQRLEGPARRVRFLFAVHSLHVR